MAEQNYDAELRHYRLVDSYWNEDEQCGLGYIYNDKKGRFSDGTRVHTSPVVKVEGDVLTTRNTRYKLVEPWRDGTEL